MAVARQRERESDTELFFTAPVAAACFRRDFFFFGAPRFLFLGRHKNTKEAPLKKGKKWAR